MRTLSLLLILTVVAAPEERPKPSPEIQVLLDTAPAAPPELAADILLRLLEYGRVPSKAQRLEIIERAFEMAGQAKFPYLQSAAVERARHTDSGPGIRYVALVQGLSTLGLRCRVVRAALVIDRARALALFQQINIGPFPPLSCDDALAPALTEYYELLREVASNAYSPEDRKKERHIELIETAVRGATIPRQLEPVAKFLAGFPLPADRKAELIGMYATALKRMSVDPRSFGAGAFDFGQAILGLSKNLQAEGISTIPLADAFRTYLARHLQGVLCAETANPKQDGVRIRRLVETVFDDGLLAATAATEIPPLKFDEMKPASVSGPAKFSDFWQTGRSREIMAQYKVLRFGTKEQQEEYNQRGRREDGMMRFLPEELRRTPEWEAQARQFLDELDHWSKNHDEPEVDFFHQMCFQYAALLDIIPAGPLHENVFRTYLSFLKTSAMERESPPEWLIHVKRLFTVTDATPEHQERLRAEVRANGSLTMSLYAELARLGAKR